MPSVSAAVAAMNAARSLAALPPHDAAAAMVAGAIVLAAALVGALIGWVITRRL